MSANAKMQFIATHPAARSGHRRACRRRICCRLTQFMADPSGNLAKAQAYYSKKFLRVSSNCSINAEGPFPRRRRAL